MHLKNAAYPRRVDIVHDGVYRLITRNVAYIMCVYISRYLCILKLNLFKNVIDVN